MKIFLKKRRVFKTVNDVKNKFLSCDFCRDKERATVCVKVHIRHYLSRRGIEKLLSSENKGLRKIGEKGFVENVDRYYCCDKCAKEQFKGMRRLRNED